VLNLSNIGFTAEYFLPLMPDSHTLCNLRSIDLSKNRIAAFPDLLLELRRVRVLNLNHNLLEEIPQDIDLLQRLEVLLLWNNKLAFLPDTISLL
jgi:leucine-rich repeat protein SHOC2